MKFRLEDLTFIKTFFPVKNLDHYIDAETMLKLVNANAYVFEVAVLNKDKTKYALLRDMTKTYDVNNVNMADFVEKIYDFDEKKFDIYTIDQIIKDFNFLKPYYRGIYPTFLKKIEENTDKSNKIDAKYLKKINQTSVELQTENIVKAATTVKNVYVLPNESR